jgi:D-arabinose 1-dehydrogenase-like Zn-dependent alcohol dehydrogenase
VYNSLRHTKALAGDVVAIQGTGGLGHLGIQFANKMVSLTRKYFNELGSSNTLGDLPPPNSSF